jgi:hypothetical protein
MRECRVLHASFRKNPMKTIALAVAVLLAGCAATNTRTDRSGARLTQLEEKNRTIAEREKQCVDKTLARNRDEIAGIAVTPAVELQIQKEDRERARELSECGARADEENAEIYAQERDEYRRQAQQERARAALMSVLTTSQRR